MTNQKEHKHAVYLLVADETEEFDAALRYAAQAAIDNNAKLAVLHVMEREDFQYWGGVEKQMHEEYVAEAENILMNACNAIHHLTGMRPSIYLKEGGRLDVVIDVINEDTMITNLVLGGAHNSKSPGPLVSYFTGKGLSKLRVPLTIVPGNFEF